MNEHWRKKKQMERNLEEPSKFQERMILLKSLNEEGKVEFKRLERSRVESRKDNRKYNPNQPNQLTIE